MAIIKCENGHFFDNSKYAQCPYCASLQNERNRLEDQLRESMTIAMPRHPEKSDENVTIPMYEPPKNDEEKTIGIFARHSGKEFVTGWLVCIRGKEKGRDYRIHNGNNWIGRSYQMDICIVDDPSISRDNHANIVYDYKSNKFFLLPGQGASVLLNGEALLNPKEIRKRDRITLGNSTFAFVPFCEEDFTWEKEKD